MASTLQSLRFLAPASAGPGGGSFDALNRILADLCTRGNPKEGTSMALRKHLEEEARDLSGEAFSRFMDQLYEKISSQLESNEVAENLGALRAIDELIDVALGENASKVSKFSIYMRNVFEVKRDRDVLTLASRVLGHLARAGGAMTADEAEFQVKMALDWLRNDRAEYRLFAAVSILKEMAENASTVFNVHVPEFVAAIWVALRHPTLEVRERAVEALRACLRVIEKRETRWPVQWYYRMFEATQDGLGKNAPVHSIHGSLLAVGELLRTAYDAELKALIWGLSWSIDKGFYPIQVEMDCLELVTHVNRTQWIRAGPSVLQRVANLLHLHSSSIHHICREGNQAAHLLATHRRLHYTSLSFTSFNSLPPLIKGIVLLEAIGTQYLR